MVVSSLCIALGLLKGTLNFFAEHFVLSVIETTHNGIWNYPFPAITVCDINRVSLNLTKKFVENLWVLYFLFFLFSFFFSFSHLRFWLINQASCYYIKLTLKRPVVKMSVDDLWFLVHRCNFFFFLNLSCLTIDKLCRQVLYFIRRNDVSYCRTLPPTVTKEFVAQEMKLLNELLYPGIYGSHVRNNLSQLQNIFDMNKLSIPTIMNSVRRESPQITTLLL